MSNKGFQSPLERARLGQLGAPKPLDPVQENDNTLLHKDVKTLKQNNVNDDKQNTTISTRKGDNQVMKRQTIFMPQELATWLKIYAAKKGDDMSGIVTSLVQELRNREE